VGEGKRNEIIFNVFYKSVPLHHPYMRDIRDDWELLRRRLFFLHFRWRLAINQTVWYGSAAVYLILLCLYTNSWHSPSHFFLCVHGGNASAVINYICRKKKKRSTYSFLKYLTNSLMTTCSPVYCSHPLYCKSFRRPAYMSTYCLCIIFFFSRTGQGG